MTMSVLGPTNAMAAVEIDIFSGRPNPSWTVPDTDVNRWLATLPTVPRPEPTAEALGYRGLIVQRGDDHIRVFNGAAIAPRFALADPARRFEAWLLSTGEKFADPKLLEWVRQSLHSLA